MLNIPAQFPHPYYLHEQSLLFIEVSYSAKFWQGKTLANLCKKEFGK